MYALREIKFKKKHKLGVGESNVYIWGMNVTSRGNSQMEGQWGRNMSGVFKEQKGCQPVEDRASKAKKRRKLNQKGNGGSDC